MKGLPCYLSERADRIRALPAQSLPPFRQNYLGWNQRPMKALYERFPCHSAQREDVVQLYREWQDPVLALIATLVWGFVDTSKKQRLQQVLAVPEHQLRERMERIRALILRRRTGEAWLSCCTGGVNHIPGIGPSYFTKIFFFVGQADVAPPRANMT
jgi:hypothetical protein